MTTFDDIKKIAITRTETKSVGPVAQIMYIEMIPGRNETDELIAAKKMAKREMLIDGIVEGDIDQEKVAEIDARVSEIHLEGGWMETISPKIQSTTANAKKLVSDEAIWDEIIDIIERASSAPHPNAPTGANGTSIFDFDMTAINPSEFDSYSTTEGYRKRRLITKMMHMSNFIATNGRIGPASTFLVGEDVARRLPDAIEDMNIAGTACVVCPGISPDKIVAVRGTTSATSLGNPGIYCIKCEADDTYFVKEVGNWIDQLCWMKVILD